MNKVFGEGKDLAAGIVNGIKGKADLPEVVLCPPFTLLQEVVEATKGTNVKVGAQNMDYRDEGAFTGQILGRAADVGDGVEVVIAQMNLVHLPHRHALDGAAVNELYLAAPFQRRIDPLGGDPLADIVTGDRDEPARTLVA